MATDQDFYDTLDRPKEQPKESNGQVRRRPFTNPAHDATTKLRATDLITPRKIPPKVGWRAVIYRWSFKKINLGESPDERHVRELHKAIRTNMRGTYTIAVVGGKGGAGKTAMTVAVGSTFAKIRAGADKVVAVDADPAQAANLAVRVDAKASSLREINRDAAADAIGSYVDIRAHTGQNDTGLDVVASVRHTSPVAPLPTGEEFSDAHTQMKRFYTILFVDCGTDLDQPVMRGVLNRADSVLMIATAGPDGAEGADTSLEWLRTSGYDHLLTQAVLIINHTRETVSRKDRKATDHLVEAIGEHFNQWVGSHIIEVPYDQHIASAGIVDLDQLRPIVRRRILEAAAAVAGGFNTTTDNR